MSKQMALDTYGSKSALRWIRILSPVGLVIAIYLTITYVQNQAPYCAGLVIFTSCLMGVL